VVYSKGVGKGREGGRDRKIEREIERKKEKEIERNDPLLSLYSVCTWNSDKNGVLPSLKFLKCGI
jgi:hypothetical protein